ncbi:hypothetical protein [Hymenobacter terrenus]|nr:hypothetical protein [Hymenobacter terrenus]
MQSLPLMQAGLLEAPYYDLPPFKSWETLFTKTNKMPTALASGQNNQ